MSGTDRAVGEIRRKVGAAGGGPVRRVESRAGVGVRRGVGIALVAWFAVPLLPVLVWAFADRWQFPAALPTRWGLGGWSAAWDQGAAAAAAHSLALGAVVAAIATPAGAAAGWALTVRRIPLAGWVAAVLFVPVAVPPFAVVMGLSTVSLRAGVPGAGAVVAVLVVAAIPYTTYVMRAAYASYDRAYEDAARTLGAARPAVLGVRLRLVVPALGASAFLAFLVGWSDYVVTLILGGGRLVTLALMLGASASGSGNDSTQAALALLTAVPPLVLLVVTMRLSRRKVRP